VVEGEPLDAETWLRVGRGTFAHIRRRAARATPHSLFAPLFLDVGYSLHLHQEVRLGQTCDNKQGACRQRPG